MEHCILVVYPLMQPITAYANVVVRDIITTGLLWGADVRRQRDL